MKKKIIFGIIYFLIFLPVIAFLHTGFMENSWQNLAQVVVFSSSLSINLVWFQSRKITLIISVVLLTITAILFMFNRMSWADMIGSSGVGLIVISLVCYLPQLVKLGYIKSL